MRVRTDFVAYHRSIASELRATQNRVRNLIGGRHWLSDGEHKEAILRKALRSYLPESMQVGRGFVCYRREASTQLDVLVTSKSRPTLFKEGDLVMVTPDCVEAIIEVKTKQESQAELTETLTKLADQAQKVRQNKPNGLCWAGLFVFDGPDHKADDHVFEQKSHDLLQAIQEASEEDEDRVVSCVALGPRVFARYWTNSADQAGGFVNGPAWHSYVFNLRPHSNLAPAYFVSNLVWEVSPDVSRGMQFAWFPIRGTRNGMGGKERYRLDCVALRSGGVRLF